jgi:cytochrome c
MFRRALFVSALLATAAAPALANQALAQKSNCLACHAADKKVVGPAYQEVAKKYASQKDADKMLAATIKAGSSGKWGQVPMPPNNVSDADALTLAKWILAGAK